jgi:preprotein translocase subunit SecD
MFLIAACSNSGQPKYNNRLLNDPEHHIKDSPEITKYDSTILYSGWYYINETETGFKRQLDKSADTYLIDPKPIVTAKNISTFKLYESNTDKQTYWGLIMQLDKEGAENWSIATRKAIGKQLAFILDNRLLYVAKVNAQISNGMTSLNRGNYTKQELENFKTILESEK